MRKRLNHIGGAAAALVALALGGSAIASATQGTPTSSKTGAVSTMVAPEKATGPDIDNVESGDQTSPDTNSAKASSTSTSETPEAGSATENASPSDGPGGHEDPEGDVDHQGEGQE
jgi:hypothetical protein